MKPESNRKKLTEMYPPFTTGLSGPKEWGSAKWKKTRLRAAKQRIPVSAGNCDFRGAAAAGLRRIGRAGACGAVAGTAVAGIAGTELAGTWSAGESSATVLWGVRRSPGNRPFLR